MTASASDTQQFPSAKSRSTSPVNEIQDPEPTKPSRKREREISLELAPPANGDTSTKARKDSLVPPKKNRTTLDSHAEEDGASGSASGSGSSSGSPPSDTKVRKLSQGVEDIHWQSTLRDQATEGKLDDGTPIDIDTKKRKFLERGTSQGPNENGTPEPTAEPQKRLKDDKPKEGKRTTPPPRTARSPPPSPKRQAAKAAGGFAAYSGTKSPFSKVKGPSIFGRGSSPNAFAPPSTASPASSPFALSPSPNIPPPSQTPAPVKPSGFETFAGSASPFASVARSKPPIFGASSRASSPPRTGTPTTNASAFSKYASAGDKGFTEPSAQASKEGSPAVLDGDKSAAEEKEKPRSFGDKLRAGKDDKDVDEDDQKVKLTEQEFETGEEDENTIHQVRGKLYMLSGEQWKEKGTGQLKLNVSDDGSSARLVMRKEAVYTLLLNVTLFPGMKFSVTPDTKYMRFSAIEDGQTVHYNLKVSNIKIARELLDTVALHTPTS